MNDNTAISCSMTRRCIYLGWFSPFHITCIFTTPFLGSIMFAVVHTICSSKQRQLRMSQNLVLKFLCTRSRLPATWGCYTVIYRIATVHIEREPNIPWRYKITHYLSKFVFLESIFHFPIYCVFPGAMFFLLKKTKQWGSTVHAYFRY